MNELEWIKSMSQNLLPHPRLLLGVGDDAAVLQSAPQTIVTADMLLDRVHFDTSVQDASLIGRKALAVNISDIAAMGGVPYACVITIAIPRGKTTTFVDQVYAGITALAREFQVAIAGGDTNTWDGAFAISITVWGDPHKKGVVKRSGARPDDVIFVSGPLGNSLAGHHLSFSPRVHLAKTLMDEVDVHAMIDLSDGLATDLRHICTASGVGALLDKSAIPIQSSLLQKMDREAALTKAMTDGEDFELCFTVSQADAQRLRSLPGIGPSLFPIGRICHDQLDLYWQTGDNRSEAIRYKGYEHQF